MTWTRFSARTGIALAMAREGARVVVSGRDVARGARVVDQIRSDGGTARFVPADLDGSAARSRDLAASAIAAFGTIGVLVNNAGIYPPDGTLTTDETTFDCVFAVNVKATFLLTAALIPAMIEADDGRVINLGSWIAHLGIPGAAVYGSTKGTTETLTRTWAAEFGAAGIRVNAISPGVVHDNPTTWPPQQRLPWPRRQPGSPAIRPISPPLRCLVR